MGYPEIILVIFVKLLSWGNKLEHALKIPTRVSRKSQKNIVLQVVCSQGITYFFACNCTLDVKHECMWSLIDVCKIQMNPCDKLHKQSAFCKKVRMLPISHQNQL